MVVDTTLAKSIASGSIKIVEHVYLVSIVVNVANIVERQRDEHIHSNTKE
jgi:hypothetical protein